MSGASGGGSEPPRRAQEVRRRRRPELALVQASAEIGKTRLADEFIRRAMTAGDDIRIVWGR